MGLYNAAAWISRRDRHLAINAVLYAALTAWEQKHVAHHIRRLKCQADANSQMAEPAPEASPIAA
jgi:hypothetical protein